MARRQKSKGGRPPGDLFQRCIDLYLTHLEVYGKATTRHTAESHCNRLREIFQKRNPNTFEPRDIADYIIHRRAHGISDQTTRRELVTLRALLNRAQKEGLIDRVVEITLPKVPRRRLPNTLSLEEIKRLIEAADRDWVEGVLRVALSTGFRTSEIRNLQWKDVDFDTGELRVSNKEDWTTKNRNERSVYVSERLIRWLQNWRSQSSFDGDDDWIFPNRWGERYTVHNVCKQVRETFQRAGIYKKGRQTLHAIRHTVATEMLSKGVDINVVREWLGHQEITTTALYLHVRDEKKRAAATRINLLED